MKKAAYIGLYAEKQMTEEAVETACERKQQGDEKELTGYSQCVQGSESSSD